jgi:hypothetical protein
VNDDSEGIWREMVIARFKVLSKHLREMTKENHEKRQS